LGIPAFALRATAGTARLRFGTIQV